VRQVGGEDGSELYCSFEICRDGESSVDRGHFSTEQAYSCPSELNVVR
jgi:hypothetical protein